MQRRLFKFLLPISWLFFASGAAAQTVDELIEKNIEARGGLEKIKALESMKLTGKLISSGMDFPLTIQKKRPNMMHVETAIQGKKIISAYDSETAWRIDPLSGSPWPEEIPEDEARTMQEESDFEGPLVGYKEKGHQVELIGKEKVAGNEAYKLKVTLRNADVRHVWLDAASFREIKISGKEKYRGIEFEADTYLSDYNAYSGQNGRRFRRKPATLGA